MKSPKTASDRDDSTPTSSSRRAFLGSAATLSALALAGCMGSDGSGAATDTPTSTSTPMPTEEPTTETEMETETETMPAVDPDVPVLNYALTLEHLENAFYRDGLAEFADDELMNASVLSGFGEQVRMDVPAYLAVVGEHEAAHVEALSATVEQLGGTPVEEAEYDFGYETPSEFLAVAQALENTGVAAYAGAAPAVHSTEVLSAAAGIHSVEARHAGFLNLVNGDSPFPKAVDEASSMQEVLEVAGQFVTSDTSGLSAQPETTTKPIARKQEDDVSDLDVLNYALTLEHLENAFYRDGLAEFADDELVSADVLSVFSEEIRANVPDHLATVGEHEAAHVTALTDVVEQLGGTPVEEAEYDFGYETPSEFFGVAQALENTGVAAYAGAAPTVTNDDIFAAAIGIHSVEARHAGFLNELNVSSPFPDGVDEAMTMAEVRGVASQFIVG
ncbi:ferritin-like domain-containing protein [Salinigranum halophilum]|uniref:ferritin-like domain-containing protein n=1 Tax=Salinigranum halophilum TaxID=2565931 RepID=UPI0010A7BBC7|nr:ferritin-like domain-containing protein [Salinigranum halophilum]